MYYENKLDNLGEELWDPREKCMLFIQLFVDFSIINKCYIEGLWS